MAMKAALMSLLDTALEAGMTVSERLKPIWQPLWQLLPSWLTGLIIWTLKWFLGLATMLALVLYQNQNAMLYHPEIAGMVRDPAGNPPRLRNPSEWLIPYEDVTVETADKLKLHCWFLKQEDTANAPTLIFFQENAGNMGMRLPSMNEFYRRLGMNVFMVSYRGYGRSEGTPTEEGLQLDAQAALDAVWARPDVDKTRILLLGRSLGGAVSVYIAEQNPDKVKGLILENTFTSIPDMVDVVMPWVAPMKSLVLRIGWHSKARIPSITAPILFVSGRRDELVPPAHMDALLAAARTSLYTVMHKVPEGKHNDTWQCNTATYNAAVRAFLVKIGALPHG